MGKSSRAKLDIVMAVLMIAAMSYQATGNLFHEITGVMLLILFSMHNLINRKWYGSLLKGKYSGYRKMMAAVNVLTLTAMLTAMGTGIYLSQSIFAPFWGMREAYLIRPVHVAAGAWGTLLVSVHGGMHIRLPSGRQRLQAVLILAAAVPGIWAFLTLDMPARLSFRDAGNLWRYPSPLLFAANAFMMLFFAGLSAAAADRLKKRRN